MTGLAWNEMNIILNARRNRRTNSSLFRKNCMHLESHDTHGSSQYRSKKWCKVCGDIVSDLDTEWWTKEKARRSGKR